MKKKVFGTEINISDKMPGNSTSTNPVAVGMQTGMITINNAVWVRVPVQIRYWMVRWGVRAIEFKTLTIADRMATHDYICRGYPPKMLHVWFQEFLTSSTNLKLSKQRIKNNYQQIARHIKKK